MASNTEKQASTPSSPGLSDRELEGLLDDQSAAITVVGCGGGGCNSLSRMARAGITGARMVAVNTDAQHLVRTTADEKLLIGEAEALGKGAGSLPKRGERAALGNQRELQDAISGSEMVFVTAGLGGGTGTGAAPVAAKVAQNSEALTVAVVTMPFVSEGEVSHANAMAGLSRLTEVADTTIVLENDRILDSIGSLPVNQAFKVVDEVLMRAVKGVSELVTTPGMVNLDFADVRTVLSSGGLGVVGIGESHTSPKAVAAVQEALRTPLLDVDFSDAGTALVNVSGGEMMTIGEAEEAINRVHAGINSDARIIWGTNIDPSLDDTIRVMTIIAGVPPNNYLDS